eukprot:SAG11_NODE_7631_length_1119_cov_0.943137_1_plen_37_part_01
MPWYIRDNFKSCPVGGNPHNWVHMTLSHRDASIGIKI